jgi:hypothetical protein
MHLEWKDEKTLFFAWLYSELNVCKKYEMGGRHFIDDIKISWSRDSVDKQQRCTYEYSLLEFDRGVLWNVQPGLFLFSITFLSFYFLSITSGWDYT